ncbi:MAG: SDR family NAD(P)-dependent oxidoreductase [Salinisphaera sp.]|jgi:NAD(P)-dependent dehydrogenase (short-subunit alcohol dehydrogenase family)|nr:SDR family NAD(P)-dependent oxidoreductase [Salinisphaera sp.]
MQIQLTGKTALITGSTGGIGLAIAQGLAGAGATVILNGRTQARVDHAMIVLRKAVPEAEVRGVVADLGTADGCQAVVDAEPRVDILINNVGLFGPQDFYEIADDTWQRFFDVNVMSGVRLARAYTPGMTESGWGRVVFISSESAINIPADMIHYGFTKTANLSVSRGLAKRLAGTGVTVNAVLPGPTLSDGVADMLAEGQQASGKSMEAFAAEFVQKERPSSLIQRAATVEEVANMVVYVASPQSSATNGAALRVDGGVVDTVT